MNIKRISHVDTLSLRQSLLRPALNVSECVFPGDTDLGTVHLGCFINNSLVGVCSIYHNANPNVSTGSGLQLRAMATDKRQQGKGVGSSLLKAVDAEVLKIGADYLWANARITAREFYQKNGFHFHGSEFLISGIGEHILIYKEFKRYQAP